MTRTAALLAALSILPSPATAAPPSSEASAQAMLSAYVEAWDRADAKALGAQFAPDGDFINPGGTYARGPAAVEAFYAAAFSAGYAGSQGGFRPVVVRRLASGVIAVDGEWSIEGAHGPDGRLRETEAGIASAILVRRHGAWRIAILREQEGARHIRR